MKMSKGKFWTIVSGLSGAIIALGIVFDSGRHFYAIWDAPTELKEIRSDVQVVKSDIHDIKIQLGINPLTNNARTVLKESQQDYIVRNISKTNFFMKDMAALMDNLERIQ